MSLSCSPQNVLTFYPPLTQDQTLTLTLTNTGGVPLLFKISALCNFTQVSTARRPNDIALTAPQCAIAASTDRLEPGATVTVCMILQALPHEPPARAACECTVVIAHAAVAPGHAWLAGERAADFWDAVPRAAVRETTVHYRRVDEATSARC
ncbi:VAMP-associated protein [Phanerochaete sordida]|uniref:VAMP-associated protein n=1 Tax=Phanerochaete sordida TaxID=48140 RepID=A0A9P3G515_9APHY|nr:VAMP-associated protein [Phanerochaete sordida]